MEKRNKLKRTAAAFWLVFAPFAAALAQLSPLQQPVSVALEQASLSESLSRLVRENELKLSFSNTALPEEPRYDYRFEAVPLEVVLNILLRNTGIVYLESGAYIVLREAGPQEPPLPPLRFNLSGYVEDARSGERLMGANVYLPALGRGTTTNADGFFSLSLPADSLYLVISYVGYESRSFRLGLFGNQRRDAQLLPNLELETVEVRAAPLLADLPFSASSTAPGRQRLTAATLQSMPPVLGEDDLLQALALLPGVQSGLANLGSINIRGGSDGHNLILLDGATIYNPNHTLGLYSIFNSSAVKDVELIKGAVPARYGGRLASVLEVNGREGNFQRWGGEAALGMIASKALVEGPLVKGKLSLLAAARRSYWDWLLGAALRSSDNTNQAGYYFNDFNVKLKYKSGQRDSWDLSFYTGQDRFFFAEQQDTSTGWRSTIFENGRGIELSESRSALNIFWKNQAASLQWHRAWAGSFFTRSSLTYSSYQFQFDIDSFQKGADENGYAYESGIQGLYFSGVRTFAARVDADWAYSPAVSLRFGSNLQGHQFQPQASGSVLNAFTSNIPGGPTTGGNYAFAPLDLRCLESGLYAEAILQRGRWQVHPGLHWASFFNDGRFWTSFQPRLSLSHHPSAQRQYYALLSTQRQYAHLLGNDAINLPTDLWVPSTRQVAPQQAWQASLGLEQRWAALVLALEAYYTKMNRLSTLVPSAAIAQEQLWESQVRQGQGRNYGLEAMLRRTQGRWTGLLSYNLSWAWRQFESLNQGEWYPLRNNRLHQIGAALNWQPTARFNFSASYNWMSGNFITVPSQYMAIAFPQAGSTQYNLGIQPIGQEINNYQAPNYHRLDISFNFSRKRSWYSRKWSLGAFNLYNRRNPLFYFNRQGEEGQKLTGIAIFSLIPSISYQLKI
jgi:hypothetical protein